jgi:hypothetical protein
MTLDQTRTPDASVFPAPADGQTLGINPDGFIWLPVDGAETYRLEVRNDATGRLALDRRTDDHYLVPPQPFPAGDYRWRFRAYDESGTPIGTREWWSFSVPEECPEAACPSAETVLEDLPEDHPRLVFRPDELDAVRERIESTQSGKLDELESLVDRAYEMGMPPKPTFHLADTERERRQRYMTYYREHREYVVENLRACALYYLLFDDEEAGAFAREMLLHVCGFNPEGPNSLEYLWGDEPGLAYARVLPEIYDWTYDRYTEKERTYIEKTLVRYTEMTYERLLDVDYTVDPTRSHPARLPGFLGQQVLLLHHRLPEAEEMLQHALDVFNTFYPHWGGDDGGWAEGPNYSTPYNSVYFPFFTTFEKHTDFSFWDRPFYRQITDFWLHTIPPNAEDMPFGDGHDTGPRDDPSEVDRLRFILNFHASVYDDPRLAARADQFATEGLDTTRLVEEFIHAPTDPVEDPGDCETSQSQLFGDVGWAAMHTDVMAPDEDTYLVFRSSPYGNVSHSHNNQNTFAIAAAGDSLAISTGHRPQHGCPHHEGWTQTTEAHNSILVDGNGQERGTQATGAITAFDDRDEYVYLCGDAADAYSDPLERFDRHVLFVRPDLFVIYDDLVANEPVPFTWLLHGHEEPDLDVDSNRIDFHRGDAHLATEVFASTDLSISHTDEYTPPVNEGMIEELRMDVPPTHHVYAETEPTREAKILSVASVWHGDDRPAVTCTEQEDVVSIAGDAFSGEVSIEPGETTIRGQVDGSGDVRLSTRRP